MADLDDFFAKKDKKKSKSKPKILTVDELVKPIIEPKREVAETKKTEPESDSQPTSLPVEEPKEQNAAEEEWKDFEEEQRKDYTGLKIGQLTINDDDEQSASNDEEEIDSEGNVGNEGVSKRGGPVPWKKVIPAEEVTQIPIEQPKAAPKIYISPALRAQNQAIASRPKPRRTAPDITNADFFPSLDAARPERQRKKKNEPAFEEVRHGSRVQRVENAPSAQPVAASNRFQSLDEEDS